MSVEESKRRLSERVPSYNRVTLLGKVLFCFGISLLLIVLLPVCIFFFSSAYAVPIEKFNKVEPRMTEGEVRQIMGAPDHIRHDAPKSTAYYYGGLGRLKRCIMEVYFGPDGRVTGKFHDD